MNIAVTGHQNLGSQEIINWLKERIIEEVKNNEIEQAYSCLAVGADQLFAEIIVQRKIPLIAIIPCYNYESTFDNENSFKNYNILLKSALEIIQLEYDGPSEIAFFNASKLMVDRCQLLIAIWNNLPAKGIGGTADVVAYARERQKQIIHLNPLTKTTNTY